MAIVGKLMQVCSGAVYDSTAPFSGSMIAGSTCWPSCMPRTTGLPWCSSPSATRSSGYRRASRSPVELTPDLVEAWNSGEVEMLLAHPASAGHGINLQHGSDTLVWFSLPWSAELFEQANARLARQGQAGSVTVHILTCSGLIDDIALRVVRRRMAAQDEMITALEAVL